MVLAILCASMGVFRAIGVSQIDLEVLWFLLASGVLLSLERIVEFSFGKDGISAKLRGLENKFDEVERIALNPVTGTDPPPILGIPEKCERYPLSSITNEDDPQKGRFGTRESNDRRISAKVTRTPNSKRYFDIVLWVESTNDDHSLSGTVTFYLHDTFRQPVREVKVKDGKAVLQLTAYGAFTVGAIADEGETKLELDLSEDQSFPKQFRDA